MPGEALLAPIFVWPSAKGGASLQAFEPYTIDVYTRSGIAASPLVPILDLVKQRWASRPHLRSPYKAEQGDPSRRRLARRSPPWETGMCFKTFDFRNWRLLN